MKPPTFTFVVPLSWVGGRPYAEGAEPRTWLDVYGRETANAEEAVEFRIRLYPTMADEIAIERRLDEVNGGIGDTVDLEVAIDQTRERMRSRVERELWPDGRPVATTTAERQAQDLAAAAAWAAPELEMDRAVIQRMIALRDRQRIAAEWRILIVDPPMTQEERDQAAVVRMTGGKPPAPGWADIAERPLRAGYVEWIAGAYMRARSQAEEAEGKPQRSGP